MVKMKKYFYFCQINKKSKPMDCTVKQEIKMSERCWPEITK